MSLAMSLLMSLGLCLSFSVPSAAARPTRRPVPSREALAAERLRHAGEQALLAKDFPAAATAFTELYRGSQSPLGLYLLGTLALAEGRVIEAQDLLRRYLADPLLEPADSGQKGGPKTDTEQQEARRVLALPRPPAGEIAVIGDRGTLVSLDGRLVGALQLSRPLLVAPGKRRLALQRGTRKQEEEIEIEAGRFTELTYDRKTSALLSAELPGVLLLDDYPGLPKEVAEKLGPAIEDAIQGERLSSFPLSLALSRAGLHGDADCPKKPDCQYQAARGSELDYVLHVQVSQPGPPDKPWLFVLQVDDAEVGAEAARSEKECAACDPQKAGALLKAALPPLFAAARAKKRAQVEVPPKDPAPTPAPVELVPVGPVEPTVKAEPTKTKPEETPPPRTRTFVRAPRPRWRYYLGGASAVAAPVLIGFGASALAVNGKCVSAAVAPALVCSQTYRTGGIGGGLLGAGAAILVGGTLAVALPGPRREVFVQAAAQPDGGALALGLSF
jgi:hypothetical protein